MVLFNNTFLMFYLKGNKTDNNSMTKKTIRDIRYQNGRLLQESVNGQKGMVERTGKSQAQLSSVLGSNPYKGIGNKFARFLEECFNKPEGWMDVWHDHIHEQIQEQQPTYKSSIEALNDEQIDLLGEVIFHIERKQFKLSAHQKARLISSVFTSCIKNNLTASDLTDGLIDAVRYSIK